MPAPVAEIEVVRGTELWCSSTSVGLLGRSALSTARHSDSIAVLVTISVLVVSFLGYLVITIPVVGISAAVLVGFPFGLLWVLRVQEY